MTKTNRQIYLIELRKNKGLTQADIAKKLNLSETAYRQKELGKREFTQDEMFYLSSFFGKQIVEIFLPKKSPKRELVI